ncbi:MAG: hypothetical protein JNL96_13500 [Planctomycetaceae bacterium]|nr:hypothetical protein [Planctomycetaceae bacterium]
MGWWDFFFGSRRRGGASEANVVDDARYRLPVVGVSAYQRHLRRICGGRKEDGAHHATQAVLTPEPGNPHDANAVKVEIDGETIGYLSRRDAFLYTARIKHGTLSPEPLKCDALIKGGWDRGEEDVGLFGVRLAVDFRPPADRHPCPCCKKPLAPTPTRAMKCPHCNGKIAVRNSHPLTEQEAGGHDAIG